MKELSKAQQKYLRKESHQHKPIFQMGKMGLTEAFLEQVDEALEKRELIKFNILPNSDEDLREVSQIIEEQLGAYVVQTIGHTVILYRPSSKAKHQVISQALKQVK
ncbi:ribosome assembly RNA-binding protein YhbY [Suicoccus acidiformans]|uniref:Ribosome assembly RNA-binding protein YhbY n=1 Tax=Suicoccus acidiformans TaxID=2036206 RepID=A0A347WJ96_9LACT|nr:ribosome assembly RNA-binding protein YhbY [Suicoccus acidiformans]AXY25153.1 ribosome assembly RNA-binding protein YhbY [Suicoccus acidiformans]